MKPHEKLLNMLETGGDDAEFNARLWCWLNGYEFIKRHSDGSVEFITDITQNYHVEEPNYLTSLDACKAVMDEYLEGWKIDRIYKLKEMFVVNIYKNIVVMGAEATTCELSIPLPTMQAAWLHAMIQAIAHERGGV